MEIKLADPCGFCFGVKRAVDLAFNAGKNKIHGSTLGPLIHNPQLCAELAEQGIGCKDTLDQFDAAETVIVRSHGVGPEIYEEAKAKGLPLIDATCPYVRAAQQKAAKAARDGYLPIIVGEKNHPEIKSILKWAGESAICVEYIKDITDIPSKDKYAVIIQTTFELQRFEEILAALQEQRPGEYRVERTICLATAERQQAAVKLAAEVDAFVVIGGRNSANTRHLYELVRKVCPVVHHIETAAELKPDMFSNYPTIGITAGASTPDRLIKEAIIAMENENFEEMLNQQEEVEIYTGKVVEATVITLDKDGVYVAFGYQKDGFVPFHEWEQGADVEELKNTIKPGDVVEVKVVAASGKSDFIQMSKIKAERDAAWKTVAELAEGEKRPATVKVLRIIKNRAKNIVGLSVAVEGVEGFMPASHVELKRVEDFTPYIGKELEAEIIEVDLEKKRIVVSRRDLLKAKREEYFAAREARIQAAREARAAAEEEAYNSIEEGTVVTGKVTKIVEFGLFVEIKKGLVGLVHNTELSWNRNAKAEDVAQVGDEVEVFIKNIDREARRVALSIKATQEDPWTAKVNQLHVGEIVECQVVRLLSFGAIAKIADRVEGLIHISEIAEERIEKVEDVLEVGQVVKAEILRIDMDQKRIGLSIVKAKRAAEAAEYSSYLDGEEGLTQGLADQLGNL